MYSPSFNCRSCCSTCVAGGRRRDVNYSGTEAPYSLDKLLPAGTVIINLDQDAQNAVCNHSHAQDGWHPFQANLFSDHLALHVAAFGRELDFLIKHRFISVTYQLGITNSIHLRVYLIPHDLSNVQGQLRIRKENVLSIAKKTLRNLLPRIKQNPSDWKAEGAPDGSQCLFPSSKDGRTLAEIYGDLKSPMPRITNGCADIVHRLLNFEDSLGGLGLRSNLYRYQRRSVAAMIQQEMNASDVDDPLYVRMTAINGDPFYFQPGSMEILRECPSVAPSHSGILCEELGTGKTVMILGLILATIYQLPNPEESIMDERPIMTPLSFRHFPSPEAVASRKRFYNGEDPSAHAVPSLTEILLHRARVAPDLSILNTVTPTDVKRAARKLENVERLEQTLPGELLAKNVPFYHHYEDGRILTEWPARKGAKTGPRVMYLTSATLIVVPINLLEQWSREIQKHCEYPLRVLTLRSNTPMPRVTSLASDYDIILMTYKRFSMESALKDRSKLHSWRPCSCPGIAGTRVPDCKCQNAGVSPLLRIRWKRLVIDEGHVSASLNTVLTPFTKLLSVERRWIVTGTPTTNLLGLSFGQKANEEEARLQAEDSWDDDLPIYESDSNREAPFNSPSCQENEGPSRIWNKDDREDLNKLGKMITHFIAVPQFAAETKLVQTHVIEPLLDRLGPRYGAVKVLTQVMEAIMIRHRIEDVEKDIVLPPVRQETILLDLDPYAIKSYNALLASIAVNAVDSQRTDQDYLFHPNNTEHLLVAVQNLSQIMFWSSDCSIYNVEELSRNAPKTIEIALKRKTPEQDMQMLREAIEHVRIAVVDPLWRAMNQREDVPYRIFNMNPRIFEAFSSSTQPTPSVSVSEIGFMHLDRLLKLRDMIVRRPRISEENLLNEASNIARDDRIHRQKIKESQKRKGRKLGDVQIDSTSSAKADDAAKNARDPETVKEMQKELDITLAKLSETETEDTPFSYPSPNFEHYSPLVAESLVGGVVVGSSTSSKLNYIINEVMQYAATEKFLVFSDSPLTLAHVADALKIINVRYLHFTTHASAPVREQMVLTFETSDKYRVFLMELKHGARGLNLISASRVVFCEPVWQADVESQAIKRAHRIGQTRAISVKVLAIRGTHEENMVARRNLLMHRQEKLPKLIEEEGMRHYIANPKFINHQPERISTVEIPLFNLPFHDKADSQTETASPRLKRIRIDDPSSALSPVKRVQIDVPAGEIPPSRKIRVEEPAKKLAETESPPRKKSVRFG